MKRLLVVVMVIAMSVAFAACGSGEAEEPEAPSSLTPTDIQVEAIEGEDANVYSVIYDIDTEDTDAWKEQWSGYDSEEVCVNTAVDGIKACKERDDWTDTSVVYGYAGEPLAKNMLYSYGDDGSDGNYTSIKLFQLGIYNDTYDLQGELD